MSYARELRDEERAGLASVQIVGKINNIVIVKIEFCKFKVLTQMTDSNLLSVRVKVLQCTVKP